MTNSTSSFIPVCIVTFGHASEVIRCLQALRHVGSPAKLEIFICENGGSAAFDRLIDSLSCSDGPCCRDPRAADGDQSSAGANTTPAAAKYRIQRRQ